MMGTQSFLPDSQSALEQLLRRSELTAVPVNRRQKSQAPTVFRVIFAENLVLDVTNTSNDRFGLIEIALL